MRVELVFFTGCPNVAVARKRLAEALTGVGLPATWQEWDTLDPETPARLLDYASPTVLLDGRDISGGTPGSGPRCDARGGPSVEAITAALREVA